MVPRIANNLVMTLTSRNSPCPCSSGKRFKHCCGAVSSNSGSATNLGNAITHAPVRLQAGELAGAETQYLLALTVQPDDPDCLYRLGLIYLQTGRVRAALSLILRAGTLTAWQVADMRSNLRRAVAAVFGAAAGSGDRSVSISEKVQAYQLWRGQREREVRDTTPLVSVIVPSYNHAAFIRECLESVYRQTWPRIELIVIDDGSLDDSVDVIGTALKSCPFPHSFVTRQNLGAHVTINEGLSLARGDYVNILNSDDRFVPRRIERMVAAVAGIGADWGFAGVEIIDADGQPAVGPQGSMEENLKAIVADLASAPTVGFALLRSNASISTGNLFISREFLGRIGGFSDLRYHHDWEFVLRASLASEAVYVPETLYQYRLHDHNTTSEAGSGAIQEGNRMLGARIHELFCHTAQSNPFAPTFLNWGEYLLQFIVNYGFEAFLPFEQVREMAELLVIESDMISLPHAP